jgi:agmatine deiminase
MLFPTRADNWREGALPAQRAFAAVAAQIARFEIVTVGVPLHHMAQARALLPPPIRMLELSANDAWMRDVGPTFVINGAGEVRGVQWQFNAWGGLYYPYDQDQQVAEKILAWESLPRYAAPLVMEGGAIHVDGEGTLLTTEECLLNPNRNPHLDRVAIEKHLRDYLGGEKILWLGAGVYNDETSGHVDNLCCFVRPGVVALTWTEDHNDPQYPISQDAYERLIGMTDAKGRALEVHKIHQPTPITLTAAERAGLAKTEGGYQRQVGERLAASYINFYMANGGVIVPQFDDPQDHIALEQLAALCPDRRVVGVPTREILLGGGNIHCITQQQPQKT